MDSFKLGNLKLNVNEAVIIGDPCYFDDTPHGCHTLELDWQAGDYPVFLVTDEGRPFALILSRNPFAPSVNTFQHMSPLEELGVDSGQMAIIAASVLPTWTENSAVDFDAPACDYDHACIATLESQLGANFLGSRLTKVADRYPSTQIGTAVASGTRYGDGVYPLVVMREDGGVTALAVLFDWHDDEDDEDTEDWYEQDDDTETND